MKQRISNKGKSPVKAAYRAALMIAALVFLFPLSARAEIRAGSAEVGLFGGMHLFQDDQNLKDKSVYGGRIGYNFTKHFGVEGVLETVKTSVDDRAKTGTREGEFGSPMDKVSVDFYHVDAVYHFTPDSKLTPFVVVGFGLASYSPAISTKDMAAINIGVGAKYWVSDNIALRLDLSDNMVTEVMQETFRNVEITLGVSIALGGKTKSAPVQAAKVEVVPEPEPVAPPAPETPVPAAETVAVTVPEPVVIIVSEPKVEEKVAALVVEPKIEEKIIIFALEDIHFEFDSSTLSKEARTILKRNIEVLNKNPRAQICVAGYTSDSGTDEYNQKLSMRRANAVRDYLINENVATPDRLSVIGYGETRPAMYESVPANLYTDAAKANMRVLFEIIVK